MASKTSPLALILTLLAASGCATLFASKSTSVSVNSDPSAADVYLDGNRVGTTPYTLTVDHKKEHVVMLRMAGRKEVTCALGRKLGAGWVVLDVLGGLLPVVIDAATGSWYSLANNSCNVSLPAS